MLHPRHVAAALITSALAAAAFPALHAAAAASAVPAPVTISPVPPHVNARAATVQVRVTPDHRDWTYALGENVRFTVTVTADGTPIDRATVTYSFGPELQRTESTTAAVPLEGLTIDAGTMAQPGFLRCKVSTEVNGKTYRGTATAAFAPEKIVATQTDPADFDAFWNSSREELARIPLEAKLTLLPEACTAAVNVYHVAIRTIGPTWTSTPAKVYGIFCEPRKPGRYPAILKVPGAGVRPYSGDPDLAARGALVLEIGIHGIPVNLPKETYDALSAGALLSYWGFNLDDRNSFYYRRVYLSCVRANDFLAARENWNGKDLLVMGASQGGQLSIVTAALDSRVTALASTHPAFCDVSAPLQGRAGGWPHPFAPDAVTGARSPNATEAKLNTARYYDTVNFARRLKAPGFYTWGYNDDVCPPTSTFAAFNAITAPKELTVTLELAHSYTPEQWEAVNAFVVRQLQL